MLPIYIAIAVIGIIVGYLANIMFTKLQAQKVINQGLNASYTELVRNIIAIDYKIVWAATHPPRFTLHQVIDNLRVMAIHITGTNEANYAWIYKVIDTNKEKPSPINVDEETLVAYYRAALDKQFKNSPAK